MPGEGPRRPKTAENRSPCFWNDASMSGNCCRSLLPFSPCHGVRAGTGAVPGLGRRKGLPRA
eukprot:5950798-Pyramimonas_sp.AAC.1